MVRLMKNEKGFSLIEVMIAIALLGIIGVAILGGLATASKAMFVADERATAESLARSQMEYVKNELYIDYSEDSHDVYDEIMSPPAGYSIDSTAVPFNAGTGASYTETGGIFDYDDGIQEIIVTVKHDGITIITLEGYKVDR